MFVVTHLPIWVRRIINYAYSKMFSRHANLKLKRSVFVYQIGGNLMEVCSSGHINMLG
jgi:hypothetical protein